MPILVKDHTWLQSEKLVNIKIPLNPGYHDKVDLFTTDSYIKANFIPFLFEVFLLHEVDSKKSTCIVKEDIIILDLVKKENIEWATLEKELTKAEKLKIKKEILEKCQQEAQQESEDKRVKKSQLERFATQRAMDVDAIQHEIMDKRRDAERNSAMDTLEEWRKSQNSKNKSQKNIVPKAITMPLKEERKSNVTITELSSSEDEEEKKPPIRKPPPRKPVKTVVRSEYVEKKKEEAAKRVLPQLRQGGCVEITHTPRTFPTPSRESAHEEEQTWLKNITLARRATGFVSEDLRPEEQDPQWCKDKGDSFFRCGNFLGAISAYTHAITLSDKLPSLFANRAAAHFALGNFNNWVRCGNFLSAISAYTHIVTLPSLFANRAAAHFALGNFHKCANDCQTALELMKPACEGNRRSRAKCIARRAAAIARMGYLGKAIGEMKAALRLLPDDEAIKKDIYDMERAWEQNPDSD